MRWCSMLLIGSACCALSVPAESLAAALARGGLLQRSGQAAEALQCLREARVEYPESMALLFSIAGAEAALGDSLLESHDLVAAKQQFEAARETYERCAVEPNLAAGAAYNAATCLLRVDNVLERQQVYEVRLDTLKAAVEALVGVLETWPDHARARKNLEHARYRLAMLVKNPPGQSEQEKEKREEHDQPSSEVAGATTQIPDATVEVEAGAIVVLRTKPSVDPAP